MEQWLWSQVFNAKASAKFKYLCKCNVIAAPKPSELPIAFITE